MSGLILPAAVARERHRKPTPNHARRVSVKLRYMPVSWLMSPSIAIISAAVFAIHRYIACSQFKCEPMHSDAINSVQTR